eukprot:gene4986-6207_t
MLKIENDKSSMSFEANSIINQIYQSCLDLEFKSLMIKEEDIDDCYLEIHSGAGGLDSMDWTEIMWEMYMKWGKRKGFDITMIDSNRGDVGFKKVVLLFKGEYSFGWLKTEMGTHKLIRISPFDSSGKRHTSFASVVVYPARDRTIQIELSPKDIRIETTRSSGPGGQHVNTTDSAVRITHIPTGTSVLISDQRSQSQNKSIAMEILKRKLMSIESKKRQEEEEIFRSSLGVNGFASDSIIRTYIMHPSEKVKDQRTNTELNNKMDSILSGEEELDDFIKKALAQSLV